MSRLLFVVRFRKSNGEVGRYKTYANSSGDASQKCRKGQVISARKANDNHNHHRRH